MLEWKKWGRIFDPADIRPHWWMQEYTQCPTPVILNEEVVRVYFACRPQRDAGMSVSYSAYIDLDRRDLTRVVGIAEQPIIPLGGPGTFDQFGVTICSVLPVEEGMRGYYTGWTRMQGVPYTMAIGMATSTDGGKTFGKFGAGPIIGICPDEPFLQSGPIVRYIDGAWHMWYITGKAWLEDGDKLDPVYQIVHATSDDGISWQRDPRSIIEPKYDDECQVSLSFFKRDDIWHGVFSYRQPIDFRASSVRSYRLGYAWSRDLETWHRDDSKVGIDVSEAGWDSQMLCYPQMAEIDGRVLLFYCGNGFGQAGLGIAELVGCTAPQEA